MQLIGPRKPVDQLTDNEKALIMLSAGIMPRTTVEKGVATHIFPPASIELRDGQYIVYTRPFDRSIGD